MSLVGELADAQPGYVLDNDGSFPYRILFGDENLPTGMSYRPYRGCPT